MKRPVVWATLYALVAAAQAQGEYPPDLPPQEVARRAIAEAPLLRAADANVRGEEANRERLVAGTEEWALRLDGQRRSVRDTVQQRFGEWAVALERPLRLPAKAAADRALGDQGVVQARVARGDVQHETARALLKGWFDWLREREIHAQWQEQTALLERQRDMTATRVRRGDAPRLELMQAEAALAQARAAREQARSRADIAAQELQRRFPALALPVEVRPTEPQVLSGDAAEWREAVLQHDHELALAREEARHARLLLARADAQRVPDPTVGIRYGSERAGEERVVGVSISIPLPGAARRAAQGAALAQAEAASQREAAALVRAQTQADALYTRAVAAHGHWANARSAAERMGEAAELTARAHGLGEASLAEVLAARRQANEAALAARLGQLDALEARYRLLLDAHLLWDFNGESH